MVAKDHWLVMKMCHIVRLELGLPGMPKVTYVVSRKLGRQVKKGEAFE